MIRFGEMARSVLLPFVFSILGGASWAWAADDPPLIFCASPANDLFVAAAAAAAPQIVPRYNNCTEAIRVSAASGGGVLLLYDGADAAGSPAITDFALDMLAQHKFRLFAERATLGQSRLASELGSVGPRPCPAFTRFVAMPGSALWSTEPADANTTLRPLDVLEPNMCEYVPYLPIAGAPAGGVTQHAALVKVAGFDTAVFGVSSADVPLPLLVQPGGHPGLMLSALRLSAVVRGRYSPVASWARLWRALLRWLRFADGDERRAGPTAWTDRVAFKPQVRPAYAADAALPADAAASAVVAGMRWLHTTSGLLVPSSAASTAATVLLDGTIATKGDGWPIAALPLTPNSSPEERGDGSLGIFEAYLSAIDSERNGSQALCLRVRTDSVAEAAGGLALGAWPGAPFADAEAAATSAALLDFLFFTSEAQQGPRGDDPRTSSVAGVLLWGTNIAAPHGEEVYSDDQYRSLLSAAFAASALNTTRYNDALARLLLGNVRIIGPLGYTQWLGSQESLLQQRGWRHYNHDPIVSELQYYQAAARAGNLWGYAVSGNATVFLDRTLRGINTTMVAFYARKWECQVGITSALSRTMLPLAWLVRVHDTAAVRTWLRDVATMLLRYQVKSGAIQEDPAGFNGTSCNHHPPTSNKAYGTEESTLSQNASNPVADLLYSFQFAFAGFHEAAAAIPSGDDHDMYEDAAARMADFAVRAQVAPQGAAAAPPPKRGTPAALAGAWLRAFDFKAWGYFASGSDTGWGPWVAETGHGGSLLLQVLGVREKHTSIWATLTRPPFSTALGRAVNDLIPAFLG